MTETYDGTVIEVGGAEMGKSGKEKPRKVVVSPNPTDDKPKTKTFRIWKDDDYFPILERNLGKLVTVEFVTEDVTFGDKSWTQNNIIGVLESDEGGDWGEPQEPRGEVGSNAGEPVTSESNGSWGTPPPSDWTEVKAKVSSGPTSKDDYWERREAADEARTRQMVAAWSIEQAIRLGKSSENEIHELAHKLILLKERIAKESAE